MSDVCKSAIFLRNCILMHYTFFRYQKQMGDDKWQLDYKI